MLQSYLAEARAIAMPPEIPNGVPSGAPDALTFNK
jgi:hypothetical protein